MGKPCWPQTRCMLESQETGPDLPAALSPSGLTSLQEAEFLSFDQQTLCTVILEKLIKDSD